MKICAKCKAEKKMSDFHRINGNPHSYCKVCVRKQMKDYAEKNRQRTNVELPKEKRCSNCKTIKMRSEFAIGTGRKDGLQSFCASCMAEKQRLKRMSYPPHQRSRIDKNKALKSLFGINLETYETIYSSQNGKCFICEGINKDGRKLAVDHEHGSGKVRGLLCHACNRALGNFKDSAQLLRKAADYIEKHALVA